MPPADTRTAILDAALALIGRAGIAGFSASALAAEVGVSKATLFHHFRSLDEIPLLAFDRMIAGLVAPDLPDEASLAEAVAAFGSGTFAVAEARRDFLRAYFTFVSGAMYDDRLRARLTASLAASTEAVAALLAPRMADPARAAELAGLLIAFLDGAVTHLLVDPDSPRPRAAWAALQAMIERSYAHADRD
jgi:AcrR family transcriptional regulator